MDKVLIKTKYDAKLFERFYYFNLFRKSASIYFFILAGALSIYLAIVNTQNPDATPMNTVIAWTFSAIILASLPAFTFGRIKATVRKTLKERGDTLEIIEITKPKIVRMIEGSKKIILGWEHFDSVYEYKDYIFMFIDRDRGLVFSKDSIVEGDIETFRKLAKNYLKPNKRGKIRYYMNFKEEAK
ncbi:MAG: YcxB family protein [Acholeplasmataceae bacterium]|nr:YcxB family protein [Acholeplasmataceae bacterium]